MKERTCSNCFWLHRLDPDNNRFGCSSNVYFNLFLKKNKDGKWMRKVNGRFYFIGKCIAHTRNTLKNQKTMINVILEKDRNKDWLASFNRSH